MKLQFLIDLERPQSSHVEVRKSSRTATGASHSHESEETIDPDLDDQPAYHTNLHPRGQSQLNNLARQILEENQRQAQNQNPSDRPSSLSDKVAPPTESFDSFMTRLLSEPAKLIQSHSFFRRDEILRLLK